MQIHLDSLLLLLEDLPTVMPRLTVQVEESIAIRTQIATAVTQNDGSCLKIGYYYSN